MTTLLALLLLSAAAPEPPPPEPLPSPLAAAVWCTVQEGGKESLGCDGGLGLRLGCYGRLCAVALLGRETLGAGAAWVAWRPEDGPTLAVGVGVVAPYDLEVGVRQDFHLVVGATASFGRAE